MRLLSWNVNGLRAIDRTGGFRRWLSRAGGDIVGIQEVRARAEQLPRRLSHTRGWFVHLVEAEQAGYSGVCLYARQCPDAVETSLEVSELDREGRLQIAHFGRLSVANVYFPNGNGKQRDNSRVPYKLMFYRVLFEHLQMLRIRGQRVLVMGDFNTAHRDIDLARPKQNRKTSGFLLEERAELDRWFAAGWIDTFRHFDDSPGRYTWWSQRPGVRARNIGWRIDYVLACPGAMPYVRSAFIRHRVLGSDHCPIGVDLEDPITHP